MNEGSIPSSHPFGRFPSPGSRYSREGHSRNPVIVAGFFVPLDGQAVLSYPAISSSEEQDGGSALTGKPFRPERCFLPCGPRGHALLSLATPFGEYPFPTGSPFIGDRNHSAYMSDLRIHLCKEEAVAFSQHNIIGMKQASPLFQSSPFYQISLYSVTIDKVLHMEYNIW